MLLTVAPPTSMPRMSLPFRPTTPATLRRPLAPWGAQILEWPDPLVQAIIVQCRKWMGAQEEDQKTPSSNMTPTHTLRCTVEVMYTRIPSQTHTRVESGLDGVELEIAATKSTTTIPGLKDDYGSTVYIDGITACSRVGTAYWPGCI